MTIFNDLAGDALINRASETPAFPDDFGPSPMRGAWRAIESTIPSLSARFGVAATQALEIERPALTRVDDILGTSTAGFLSDLQAQAKRIARHDIPRPWELGTVGGVIHGAAVTLPEMILPALAAAPAGPVAAGTAAAAYTTWSAGLMRQMELEAEGVDPLTAARVGFSQGAMTGLGAFAPPVTAIGAGFTRLASQFAGQAAINVGFGVAGRASSAALLREGGYPSLAEQYQALSGPEMVMDAIVGGVFGLTGLSSQPRATPRPRARTIPATPSVDDAMADHNSAHASLDTLPGVPRTPFDHEAHVEAVVAATEQLAAGERVTARGGEFDPFPPEMRRAIEAQHTEIEDAARALASESEAERAASFQYDPEALTSPRQKLAALADEVGWAERGGRIIRAFNEEQTEREAMMQSHGGNQGEVVGRTKWIAKSDFWPDRPDRSITEAQARKALEKADAGEPLSPREERFVDYARRVSEQRRAEVLLLEEDAAAAKREAADERAAITAEAEEAIAQAQQRGREDAFASRDVRPPEDMPADEMLAAADARVSEAAKAEKATQAAVECALAMGD